MAGQAALPINHAEMTMFRMANFPAGVADIFLQDMIDIDQAEIFLETCDHGIGNAHFFRSVVEEVPLGNLKK